MFTYEFVIVNGDDCEKNVFVNGNSFYDAMVNMKREYGTDWSVYYAKLISG